MPSTRFITQAIAQPTQTTRIEWLPVQIPNHELNTIMTLAQGQNLVIPEAYAATALNIANVHLQRNVQSLQTTLQELQQDLATQKKLLEDANAAADNKVDTNSATKITTLKQQIKELKVVLANANFNLETTKTELAAKSDELKRSAAQLSLKDIAINELGTSNTKLQQYNSELQRALAQSKQRESELNLALQQRDFPFSLPNDYSRIDWTGFNTPQRSPLLIASNPNGFHHQYPLQLQRSNTVPSQFSNIENFQLDDGDKEPKRPRYNL